MIQNGQIEPQKRRNKREKIRENEEIRTQVRISTYSISFSLLFKGYILLLMPLYYFQALQPLQVEQALLQLQQADPR